MEWQVKLRFCESNHTHNLNIPYANQVNSTLNVKLLEHILQAGFKSSSQKHHTLYAYDIFLKITPDGKVHRANIGPIWDWQDPGGPHVGPMNFAF